ncbi:hypothetical protein COCNU_01G002670 [Cocos nucifera]|uniref:SCD domain-containing protein n=1 Tax=Cocos nucifera TaxID=13894 RepID=A0A8K0HU21_COCNU|nr:hypothetical protein COCNU_01G002670 [Cocos nucifera]
MKGRRESPLNGNINDTGTPKVNPDASSSKDALIKAALDKLKESKKNDDDAKSVAAEVDAKEDPMEKAKDENKSDANLERNRDRERERSKARDRDSRGRDSDHDGRGRDSDRDREWEKELERQRDKERRHRSKDKGSGHSEKSRRHSSRVFLRLRVFGFFLSSAMENAAVASETSVRHPKRGRVWESSDGAPSKSSGSVGEKPDQTPTEGDQGSGGDGSFDGLDDPAPKAKRKRGAAVRAAGWREDQSLIDIIKSNGKLINHAVKQWVERYEADPKSAMVEILMMLFEACGAKYQLDAGSLDETNVDDVVVALVELAKNGEVEDYYNSKQKDLKNFKENLASFWDNLVLECQNGPLFDGVLFDKCMGYVIALSCTPPRIYRQVASLIGLQLVTSFITVAKTLSAQRETTQRQLNAEKKKRNDGPRVESLNKRLSLTHDKISFLSDKMMREIFTGLFMHRYRDVDAEIRMSCIKSLGIWTVSYPSHFLRDLYLKYLGWTLNDKADFTSRFCNRMIELADDIDISVAVSAIGLLKLLLRFVYMFRFYGPMYLNQLNWASASKDDLHKNFKTILELITDAFFKHGEKDALRSCIKAITFCSTESQADLQDFAQNKLKYLENELIAKLKSAMKDVAAGDDEYSLLVNLKRFYELQLTKFVSSDGLYEDMANILRDLNDMDNEACKELYEGTSFFFCCSDMFDDILHFFSEASVTALLLKRDTLFEQLEYFTETLPEVQKEGRSWGVLSSRVCIILAEMWCLFKKSKYSSTSLESLGYCPDLPFLQKFWKLCEQQLNISDETEDEDANEEYIEETNRDAVMIAAAKLVATDALPKDYLGPVIISHFVMHGTSIMEIIKHLVTVLKKTANDDIPTIFLEALKTVDLDLSFNDE